MTGSDGKRGKPRGASNSKGTRRSRPVAVPQVPSDTADAEIDAEAAGADAAGADAGATSTAIPIATEAGEPASTAVPVATAAGAPTSTAVPAASASGSVEVSIATGVPPVTASGAIEVTTRAIIEAHSAPAAPAAMMPASSGSIEISTASSTLLPAMSGTPATSGRPEMPVASESGSIAVEMSGPTLPAPDGVPAAIGDMDSAPVSSGRVRVAVAGEATGRSRRITEGVKGTIGEGVSRLGAGIGTIGEGVSKLGEKSRKVPIVGSSVSMIGEGLSQVGESLHELPRVARTRRGRLLVRSLIVGFVLVASWIAIIVALQLKGNTTPDFRPLAEQLLVELSKGPAAVEAVYDTASPRFLEFSRKERFIDEMSDLTATLGKFREVTAVNDTLVTTGPSGRIGRVSLTVAYENGTCRAAVSLHEDQGVWKLLGIAVELPPELTITQAQREARVKACRDPLAKSCDLYVAADAILGQLRDGQAGEVWDEATAVFQKQDERARFVQIQAEHTAALGGFLRIISVSEAKVYGGTHATYDVISQFARASGVRTIFGFYRLSKADPWKLRSLKIVVPMPRADEQPPSGEAPMPDPNARTRSPSTP